MKYTCVLKKGNGCETWEAEVCLLKASRTGRQYEAKIEERGTYFHILTGQHKYGDYLCIPNYDVGCERSKLSDFLEQGADQQADEGRGCRDSRHRTHVS